MIEINKNKNFIKYFFPNDKKNTRLKLLVTLSPIFIACFDNGNYELEFLKKTIENSNFPYAIYPNYFEGFNKEKYFKAYKDVIPKEDIILNSDDTIDFYINPMDEIYVLALKSLIEGLIINNKANIYWTNYFKNIRNDIVINGRRSIIANGIQGFYLNKYVLVWMMDLCHYIKINTPSLYNDVNTIYELSSNLKTIRDTKISKIH
ncbi:hypothetical protein [Anaerococcus sp.]|uniref:hypothetical protein n=1 Tax=Anaerococcus sp. TaxID=1872515 RepID=UPI00257CF092|nr:hypothetical protein [Anaerococcus sp.]MBS6105622.1 hypothetical protein [Anaerococcus sp.]